MKLRKKEMEQLQFNGVVLEIIRYFDRLIVESHRMII